MANENPGTSGEKGAKGQARQPAKAEQGQAPHSAASSRASERGGEERRSSGLVRRRASAPTAFGRRAWGASPFALMRRMMEDMDRLFDEYVPGRFAPESERRDVQPRGMPFFAVWEPQVDVVEREGKLVVRADLPGLKKEDVQVEITDEGLVLQGERRSEIEEERQGLYRAERSYGSFRRVIPLPEGVDASSAQAHFENGVLEITIPLPKDESNRKRIEIEEGKPPATSSQMH